MPSHLSSSKRYVYKISDDILLLILHKMDPVSLLRTCQAFQRVFVLVMQFQHLQYKYELAVFGMLDGPVPYAARPPPARLGLLLAYKNEWPKLTWSDERKLSIAAPAACTGVSGEFFFHVGPQTFELAELPAARTGRAPHQTHHLKFSTSSLPECIAVDANQSLIVACNSYISPEGQIGLRLNIRNLWNYDSHPKVPTPRHDFLSQVTGQRVAKMTASLCATTVAISVEFQSGMSKHLLLNWSTFEAMASIEGYFTAWLDDQDVVILNPYHVLAIRRLNGRTTLGLYNVQNMRNVTLEREYELPPIWANATMRFGRNGTAASDAFASRNALFYSNPDARVLTMTAKPPGGQPSTVHCMFAHMSFFRPTPHADRRSVPWHYWSQFCLIRELPSTVVDLPQVVGSRILYLEKFDTRPNPSFRLNSINFAPYDKESPSSSKSWTHTGPYAQLIPFESSRDLGQETTFGMAVSSIHATEDNLVLVFEPRGDMTPVNVLTFGVPISRNGRGPLN